MLSTTSGRHALSKADFPRPPWMVAALSLALGAAVALPLLPDPGWKFWKLEYISWLVALLVLPSLLFRRETSRGRILRRLVLFLSLAFFGFMQWACPRPIGSIELLILNLKQGQPIGMFALKLGVLLALALLAGRYFCGWLCPNGFIQDLVHHRGLGITVPRRLDLLLKKGKYLALLVLVAAPLIWDFRLFREIDPFKVVFNLDGSTLLVSLLALTLLASLFVHRAFCRYACPIGGLLGIMAAVSPTRIRVSAAACTGCARCVASCPVGALDMSGDKAPRASASECIGCKECEVVCPTGGLVYAAGTPQDSFPPQETTGTGS